VLAIIPLAVAIGVMCGAYLPNRLFNARAQEQVCDVYASVGASSPSRYNVLRNIKPYGATCWQTSRMATFQTEAEANAYASGWLGYTYRCLWDPQNPCEYYNEYADTVGTMTIGIICCVMSAGFFLAFIVMYCMERQGYDRFY
jgi:hypothetical protein